jgi:hypothetical protein
MSVRQSLLVAGIIALGLMSTIVSLRAETARDVAVSGGRVPR